MVRRGIAASIVVASLVSSHVLAERGEAVANSAKGTIAVEGLGSDSGVFLINVRSRHVERLTTGATDAFGVWSPGGSRFAFSRLIGRTRGVHLISFDRGRWSVSRVSDVPAGE